MLLSDFIHYLCHFYTNQLHVYTNRKLVENMFLGECIVELIEAYIHMVQSLHVFTSTALTLYMSI